MTEQNYSIDRDLKEAQTMLKAMVPYIYEGELYGKLGMNMPSLTPGALLLRLNRLRALHDRLTPAQASTLEKLEAEQEALRKEWSTHYQKKLQQEIEARARDISIYAKECDDDPRTCANSYMPEALRRTIIQEITGVFPDSELQSSGLGAKIKQADSSLRRFVRASSFVWDDALKPVYPQETYWWLYNRPPQPTDGRK
jgi:hypothetical protein